MVETLRHSIGLIAVHVLGDSGHRRDIAGLSLTFPKNVCPATVDFTPILARDFQRACPARGDFRKGSPGVCQAGGDNARDFYRNSKE